MSSEIASLTADFSGLEYTEWADSDVCKPPFFGIYEVTCQTDWRDRVISVGPDHSSGIYSYWGQPDPAKAPFWGLWKITPEVVHKPSSVQRLYWRGIGLETVRALSAEIRGGGWRIKRVTCHGAAFSWEVHTTWTGEDSKRFKNLQEACEWLVNAKLASEHEIVTALRLRNTAAKAARSST